MFCFFVPRVLLEFLVGFWIEFSLEIVRFFTWFVWQN